MTTGQWFYEATGRNRTGRALLKSYLVEANAPEVEEGPDGLVAFFKRADAPTAVDVSQTDDPTLNRVLVGKRGVEFFLDTLNPRFWIMYTTAHAQAADSAVRTLIHRSRFLDAFWLPTDQFEQWAGELGVPRTLTAKFSLPTGIYQESIPEEEFLKEALLLRLGSRGDARRSWKDLAETEFVAPRLSLWSAKIMRTLPDINATVLSDVTAAGKITSRGNSFRLHQELANGMRLRYSNMIEDWEKKYRLDWSGGNTPLRLSGSTALIRMPTPLTSDMLSELVQLLFSTGEPFRLFGVPMKQGDERYVVRAIDLHTGDALRFEIASSFIRAYLSATTCGNVLARLLTNLQHFVDARIDLS